MLEPATALVLGIERGIGTGAGASAALELRWEINLGVKIEPYGELFCVIVGEGLSLAVSLSLGG